MIAEKQKHRPHDFYGVKQCVPSIATYGVGNFI